MRRLGYVLLFGASLLGCDTEATQIVVVLDTSRSVPCEVDTIELDITGPRNRAMFPRRPVSDGTLPETVTLVPEDGTPRVTIVLNAYRRGSRIGQARAGLSFEDGRSLLLPMYLTDEANCFPGPCDIPLSEVTSFSGSLPDPLTRISCDLIDAGTPDGCADVSETCNGIDDDCDESVDEDAQICPLEQECLGGRCVGRIAAYAVAPTNPALEPFVSACTSSARTERLLESVDEQESEVTTLPDDFDFRYYGQPIPGIWVGENGYVAFTADAPMGVSPVRAQQLFEDGTPRPALFPFWDGLATGSEGVCVAVTGTAPGRRVIITWERACFESCGPQDELTFSVVLDEYTDQVLFLYETMQDSGAGDQARGSTATIGLSDGVAPTCEEGCAQGTCASGSVCGYTQASYRTQASPEVPDRIFTPTRIDTDLP